MNPLNHMDYIVERARAYHKKHVHEDWIIKVASPDSVSPVVAEWSYLYGKIVVAELTLSFNVLATRKVMKFDIVYHAFPNNKDDDSELLMLEDMTFQEALSELSTWLAQPPKNLVLLQIMREV